MHSVEHLERTRKKPWETWNEERDVQVRTEWEDKTLFVFFQGSQSNIDWKINFTFWIKPYKRMNAIWFAHRGFVLSYKAIRERLLEEASKAEEIKVSGYSQGAAYAILTHEDLKYHNMNVETVAYAPPRVFWLWGLNKIKERFEGLTLIINKGDPVTSIPFWIWGYRHKGVKVKLGKGIRFPWHTFHMPNSYRKELGEANE